MTSNLEQFNRIIEGQFPNEEFAEDRFPGDFRSRFEDALEDQRVVRYCEDLYAFADIPDPALYREYVGYLEQIGLTEADAPEIYRILTPESRFDYE